MSKHWTQTNIPCFMHLIVQLVLQIILYLTPTEHWGKVGGVIILGGFVLLILYAVIMVLWTEIKIRYDGKRVDEMLARRAAEVERLKAEGKWPEYVWDEETCMPVEVKKDDL